MKASWWRKALIQHISEGSLHRWGFSRNLTIWQNCPSAPSFCEVNPQWQKVSAHNHRQAQCVSVHAHTCVGEGGLDALLVCKCSGFSTSTADKCALFAFWESMKKASLLGLSTEVLPTISQLWCDCSSKLLSLRWDMTGCTEIRKVAHVFACINICVQLYGTSRSCHL